MPVSAPKSVNRMINANIIAVFVLCIIGILVRLPGLDYISGDMAECLLPWYDALPMGQGIGVLKDFPGNYGMPYATVIWLLHLFPGQPHIKIKIVSIIFEYLTAVASGLLASSFFKGKRKMMVFVIAFGMTLLYPVLVINGAYWGQCDGIYSFFVLMMIYMLLRDKNVPAMVFLGFAVAFKLQTMFIIPFVILYYFRRRSFSLKLFLIVPLVVEILYIPAFIAGYGPLAPITIYMGQASFYPQMYMHYPGLWCYFWSIADYEMMHLPVIGWVLIGYAVLFAGLLLKGRDVSDKTWLSIAFWSALFPVYFFPAMHERYSFLAELIGITYFIVYLKRFFAPLALWATISWAVYQPIIMDRFPEQYKTAIGMFFILALITYLMAKDIVKDEGNSYGSLFDDKRERTNKGWKLFDKYGIILIAFSVIGLVFFSLFKTIGFVATEYSEYVIADQAIPRTVFASLYDGMVGSMGPYAFKSLSVVFLIVSAFIWSRVAFFDKKGIKPLVFVMAFLFMPVSALYSVLLGSIDGICLLLSGIGTLFIARDNKLFGKYMAAGVLFGLSIAIFPAYLILLLGVIMIINDRKEIIERKYLITIGISILIAVISACLAPCAGMDIGTGLLALVSGFKIHAAALFPVSVLLLIMCFRNYHYILPMIIFQYGVTIGFGRYIAFVRAIHHFLIPLSYAVAGMMTVAVIMIDSRIKNQKDHSEGIVNK